MPLVERPAAGEDKEDQAEQSGWRRLEWHRPTLLWFASFLAASAGCLAWLALLCWARWTKNNLLEDLDIHSQWDGWVTRAVTLSALSVAIAIYYVVRSMPAWMPQRHPMSDVDFPMAGAFWLGLAALTAAAVVPWWGRTPFNKWHLVGAIACATPMLSTLGVVLTVRRADDEFHYWMFFLRRSQDYLNGIDPLLPPELLGLGLIGFAWASHMGGIIRTERFICLGALTPRRACTPDSPAQPHKAGGGPLAGTWGKCLVAVCVTLACWCALFLNFHSLETMRYDLGFTLAAAALVVWTILEGLWFMGDWSSVRSFLDWLELHPIRFVASDLPKEKDEGAIWEPNPRRRSYLFYARSAECLERLARELPESPKPEEAAGQPPLLTRGYVAGVAQNIRQYLANRSTGDGEFRGTIETPLAELAKLFERELEDVDGRWKRGASELERAAKEKEMAKAATSPPIDAGRLMEEFLAVRLAAYLRSIFLLIRNRLTAMTAGFVAITLSLNSYPFGRERVIQVITLLLAAVLGAIVLKVFTEMQHNPMLARFSGADGGQMSRGFLAKLLSAAALPLLSLLASYTPAINQLVGGWLQPALTSLAK